MTEAKVFQAQLDEIAESLGCVMEQPSATEPGMMYVEEDPPRIVGPVMWYEAGGAYPDLSSRYFTMLHELGHVVRGHTQGRPPYTDQTHYFDNGVLRSEAEAWEFALDEALTAPTIEAARFMRNTCIGSYWRGARMAGDRPNCTLGNGNRHHVRFQWDKPDGYFHSIIDRLDALCR